MMLEQLQARLELRMIALLGFAHTLVLDRTIVWGLAKVVE